MMSDPAHCTKIPNRRLKECTDTGLGSPVSVTHHSILIKLYNKLSIYHTIHHCG